MFSWLNSNVTQYIRLIHSVLYFTENPTDVGLIVGLSVGLSLAVLIIVILLLILGSLQYRNNRWLVAIGLNAECRNICKFIKKLEIKGALLYSPYNCGINQHYCALKYHFTLGEKIKLSVEI